jgi:hypothetical protein
VDELHLYAECGSDTLDDIRATPCPKIPPSEAINAHGVFQYVVQPSSLDLSLVTALSITGREREEIQLHIVISIRQSLSN